MPDPPCPPSRAHDFGKDKEHPAAIGCFWQPECRNRAGTGDSAAADSAVSGLEVIPVQKPAATMGSRTGIRQRKNEGH